MILLASLRGGRFLNDALSVALSALLALPSPAANLPIPCGSAACAGGPSVWVTDGSATLNVTGNSMVIDQATNRALLNWAEFNIGGDSSVRFNQPDATSLAINRIFQASPSQIFGRLDANGQIYLINQNGILFGEGSQVNVGGLIASSLDIDDDAIAAGILNPALLTNGRPAFQSDGRVFVVDGEGNIVENASGEPIPVAVVVEDGARIQSDPDGGGRVALLGQQVRNGGQIESPRGQVVLAAGEKVYLQASSDPDLRGLLVEVDAGGQAWNQLTGDIGSDRGNVSLVGLAVNQDGRVSATTSVSANGSVRLLARDTVDIQPGQAGQTIVDTTRTGEVSLGAGSVTEILPDASDIATAVDDQPQPRSFVEVMGRDVRLLENSTVRATGGDVGIKALPDPRIETPADTGLPDPLPADAESRIRIQDGAVIDVSGSDVSLPVENNLIEVELRANELKDAPLQREGPLRGETIVVDARKGTPLADISGAVGTIQRGVEERTVEGGNVTLSSRGDVAIDDGATVDVSGGVKDFNPGVLDTSRLVTADGRLVDVSEADPNEFYVGIRQAVFQRSNEKWGVQEESLNNGIPFIDPGSIEGADAGTVQVLAPALVIDGSLIGRAINGQFQRRPETRALGGRLIIGDPDGQGLGLPDYRAPSIRFVNDIVPVNPAVDQPLPAELDNLALSTRYLGEGGFTRTELYSNGVITVDERLDLLEGTSLSATASTVSIGADISGTGASIAISSVNINPAVIENERARPAVIVADDVTVDSAGAWTNDNPVLAGLNPTTPINVDGGAIDLAVEALDGELIIGNDVKLNADAGAWLDSNFDLVNGNGGDIRLAATGQGAAIETGSNLMLSGFGFARGGRLEIAANQISVAGNDPAFAATVRGDPLAESAYRLSGEMFSTGGFNDYSLLITGNDLAAGAVPAVEFAAPTNVRLQAERRRVTGDFVAKATATPVADLSVQELSPLNEREPTNLRVELDPAQPGAAALRIGNGSQIFGDPRARATLTGQDSIQVDGSITIPAGVIDILVDNPPEARDSGFDPNAGIFVGASARLSVRGVAVLTPNALGLRTGEVLPGGSVTLQANRGQVDLADGSVIDIGGAVTALDFRARGLVSNTGQPLLQARAVGSAGGDLRVIAAEGARLAGSLAAAGGTAKQAGGSLELGVSRQRGWVTSSDNLPTFPTSSRRIVIGADMESGQATPNGEGLIDAASVMAAGVATLTLQADDEIAFANDLNFRLPARMALETPNIALADSASNVRVAAGNVALGPRLQETQTVAPATPGTGRFEVTAGVVDLFGQLAVQGAAGIDLSAENQLRATGINQLSSQGLSGALEVPGDLTLQASQVLPTTYSEFRIASNGADSTISILPSGQQPGTPLSAAGRLTISASNIEQRGHVVAPLGRIALEATNRLLLADDSLTSVAAGSDLLPFGRVLNSTQWVYDVTALTQETVTVPPEKRIALRGDTVEVSSGAVLDLSGGGDLYAYEWLPGPGGSVDRLSPAESPGLFAILPQLGAEYAPFDTQEFAQSDLQPGDSITLDKVPGLLDAGTYPLLPARYALLPGAVLVEARPEIRDLNPGEVVNLPDGSPVVGGARTIANTGFVDSRSTGYAVRPGSYGREIAEYIDYFGNQFFTAQALANDRPVPLLARDAGALGLDVGGRLLLDGALQSTPEADGRGAQVDLSANELRIVADEFTDVGGVVQIPASRLIDLGADSLLLGGSREQTADGTRIDPAANSVTIAADQSLTAPEIIAVATGAVRLEAGSRLQSDGAADDAQRLLLFSDEAGGAMLAVSNSSDLSVQRGAGSQSGDVELAAGSTLSASGSMVVDAGGAARTFGELLVDEGSLRLASSRIVLGAEQDAVADGLALSNADLARLAGVAELTFNARKGLEFANGVTIGSAAEADPSREVVFDTPVLFGSGAEVNISAASVELRNTGGSISGLPGGGDGSLSAIAREVSFAGGDVAIDGFASVALSAADRLRALDETLLRAAADLEFVTPLTEGAAGSALVIDAPGQAVHFVRSGDAADSPAGLGAVLEVSAGTVATNVSHRYPSGRIRLAADGSDLAADPADETTPELAVGAGATLDVSGRTIGLGSAIVDTPGGSVQLLAERGDVDVDPAAHIDVSGRESAGDAGDVTVLAGDRLRLAGEILGKAGGDHRGGSLTAIAARIDGLADLLGSAVGGGFNRRLSIETRRGDIDIGSADRLVARDIVLAASGGDLTVAGEVTTGGAARGSIVLAALRDLTIEPSARIDSSTNIIGDDGGDILLSSSNGLLSTRAGAVIDLSGHRGGRGGELTARASVGFDGLQISELSAEINGESLQIVEPVLPFELAGDIDDAVIAQATAGLTAFMDTTAPAIRQQLALEPVTVIRPGLEIRAPANTRLLVDWDLADVRFNDGSLDANGNAVSQPGVLTIRAGGNMDFQGDLSDGIRVSDSGGGGGGGFPGFPGFPGAGGDEEVEQLSGPSWSYRVAAGADLDSALPWATAGRGLPGSEAGSLSIADSKVIRTGTGSVTLAAATDIELVSEGSLVYTAGEPARPADSGGGGFGASFTKNYARDGGDITLLAGRDIIAAPTSQLISGWLVRTSAPGTVPPTQWAPDIAKFRQGVAALGGGDIAVAAGKDISNLSIVVPTSAAERDSETGVFDRWGGGDVDVTAGRDILSGVFSTWSGRGNIRAGRDIAEGRSRVGALPLRTLLAFGDGDFQLLARRNLEFESNLNPTVAEPLNGFPTSSFFWTYSPTDRLDMMALGGDMFISNDPIAYGNITGQLPTQTAAIGVYPATVNAHAPNGDLQISGDSILLPAPAGNLQLIAGKNLVIGQSSIAMSDVRPELVPVAASPVPQQGGNAVNAISLTRRDVIHADDPSPARLIAAQGNVEGGLLQLSKHASVEAGRDIRDLSLQTQNTGPRRVTRVQAGRDFVQSSQTPIVEVAGPGQLQVLAGRNVNLGFSKGLTTIGNTTNANLPYEQGADLQVWTGLGSQPDYDGFNKSYIEDSDDYRQRLVDYMEGLLGQALTGDEALQAYLELPFVEQRSFILDVYYNELRESGREFTAGSDVDYTRGFAAEEALFPAEGSYDGDLSLVFSRIYTLDGGDIDLQVPGGLVNVGLAVPPAGGVTKAPSELGIVAQGPGAVRMYSDGDVLVNQSRVFTLQGGDIVIWSSAGDIDAGRGAKSSISAPEPVITIDDEGNVQVEFSDAIAGSGIRGILTDEEIDPGDVDLIAPTGEVNAGDAGIGAAGNLNIAAPRVVGLDNIQVGGISTGVPTDSGGVAAALTGVSSLSASATSAAESTASRTLAEDDEESPLAAAALGWLELFVEGFGEEDAQQDGGS